MYVASIFGYNEYIEINAFITGSFAIGIISGEYSTDCLLYTSPSPRD